MFERYFLKKGRKEGRKERRKGRRERKRKKKKREGGKERRIARKYNQDCMLVANPKIQTVLASHDTALTETLQIQNCLYLLSAPLHKI